MFASTGATISAKLLIRQLAAPFTIQSHPITLRHAPRSDSTGFYRDAIAFAGSLIIACGLLAPTAIRLTVCELQSCSVQLPSQV